MSVTAYKIIKVPMHSIELAMQTAIEEGWQPWGQPMILEHAENTVMQAVVKLADEPVDEGTVIP